VPRDISDELTDLEMRMLKAVDTAWDDWEERKGPLPGPLVTLMTKTHAMLMARVAKIGQDETLAWGPPEIALLRLEKVRAALVKQIEQKAKMS
jgi:hypothetical protein